MTHSRQRGSAAITGLGFLALILGAAFSGMLFLDFFENDEGEAMPAEFVLMILEKSWEDPGEVFSSAFTGSLLPGEPKTFVDAVDTRRALGGRLVLLICFIALGGGLLAAAGFIGMIPGIRPLGLLFLGLAALAGIGVLLSLAWFALTCATSSGELFKFFSLTGWSFWAAVVLGLGAAGAGVALGEELEAAI